MKWHILDRLRVDRSVLRAPSPPRWPEPQPVSGTISQDEIWRSCPAIACDRSVLGRYDNTREWVSASVYRSQRVIFDTIKADAILPDDLARRTTGFVGLGGTRYTADEWTALRNEYAAFSVDSFSAEHVSPESDFQSPVARLDDTLAVGAHVVGPGWLVVDLHTRRPRIIEPQQQRFVRVDIGVADTWPQPIVGAGVCWSSGVVIDDAESLRVHTIFASAVRTMCDGVLLAPGPTGRCVVRALGPDRPLLAPVPRLSALSALLQRDSGLQRWLEATEPEWWHATSSAPFAERRSKAERLFEVPPELSSVVDNDKLITLFDTIADEQPESVRVGLHEPMLPTVRRDAQRCITTVAGSAFGLGWAIVGLHTNAPILVDLAQARVLRFSTHWPAPLAPRNTPWALDRLLASGARWSPDAPVTDAERSWVMTAFRDSVETWHNAPRFWRNDWDHPVPQLPQASGPGSHNNRNPPQQSNTHNTKGSANE